MEYYCWIEYTFYKNIQTLVSILFPFMCMPFKKPLQKALNRHVRWDRAQKKKIQLKNRKQRLRGNNQFLQHREVISEIFQELVLGSVLVNMFRNNLEKVVRR